MRLGVIVRGEDRGLGSQTWEVARHLNPERVLLVEPRPAGWPIHAERFAEWPTTVAVWARGQLPERTVRQWLDGLDAVYTAESDYDPRMSGWCAAAGVTLVRHANPEQLAREEVEAAGGTVWWAATPWRLEHLPPGTRVVPMPVALDRFPDAQRSPEGDLAASRLSNWGGGAGRLDQQDQHRPVRFLHSIGHQAQDDRAGSRVVSRAVQRVRYPCELWVRCQDRHPLVNFRLAHHVAVRTFRGGVDDYWRAYDGCDVLVLPRRYGGLSLPSQEALAAGLALIMPDCPPNDLWPGPKVRVAGWRTVHMRCGEVEVADPDPSHLAELMSWLAEDRDALAGLQREARAWAEANSWEALRGLWLAELRSASSSPSTPAMSTVSATGGG